MSAIIRRDPVRETLEEALQWLDTMWSPLTMVTRETTWPALDIYSDGNTVTVQAVIPGVRPEDVDVVVEGNRLRVRARMAEEREERTRRYHLRERREGRWYREVVLPVPVNVNKARASLKDGILTITLPVQERAKPTRKRIKVKGARLLDRLLKKAA